MPSTMPVSRRLTWAAAGWAAGFVGSIVTVLVVAVVLAATGSPPDGASGEDIFAHVSLGGLVLLQLPLWLGLLGAPLLARRRGLDWKRQMAWRMRLQDLPIGAAVGLGMQLVAVPLLYWPILRIFGDLDVEEPARELTALAETPFDVALLVLMTVVMAPIAEEVFFRGLLQGALADGLGSFLAVAIGSVAFAVTHFQVVQFPALVLVGVVHGLMVVLTGRLGAALWSHATFNAVTVVALVTL